MAAILFLLLLAVVSGGDIGRGLLFLFALVCGPYIVQFLLVGAFVIHW